MTAGEGDLYAQGREIGSIWAASPKGFRPNVPMTWGAQPHKGHVYATDMNSGVGRQAHPEAVAALKAAGRWPHLVSRRPVVGLGARRDLSVPPLFQRC